MTYRLIGVAVLVSYTARAQDDEQALIKERDGQLQEQLADVNKKCGTALTATLDWAAFQPAMKAAVKPGASLRDTSNQAMGACGLALEAVSGICSPRYQAYGAQAVKAAIKALRCSLAPAGKPAPIAMELKDGTLEVRYGLNAVSDSAESNRLMGMLTTAPDERVPAPMTVMERAMVDDRWDRVTELLGTVSSSCGKELKVTIDWEKLLPHFRQINKSNVKQTVFSSMEGCLSTLEAMVPLCAHGNLGKAVKNKIDTVACSLLDPKIKRKVELSLSNHVLTTKLNGASANFDEQARAFLSKL